MEHIATPSGIPDVRLHLFDLATDEHFTRDLAADTGCCNLAWAPDGSRLALSQNHGLHLFDDTLTLVMHGDIGAGSLLWAPDGSRVLKHSGTGQLHILSRDGQPVAAGTLGDVAAKLGLSDIGRERVDHFDGIAISAQVMGRAVDDGGDGEPSTPDEDSPPHIWPFTGKVTGATVEWDYNPVSDVSPKDGEAFTNRLLGIDREVGLRMGEETGMSGSGGGQRSSDGSLYYALMSPGFQGSRPADYPRSIAWVGDDNIAGHIAIGHLPYIGNPAFDVVYVPE